MNNKFKLKEIYELIENTTISDLIIYLLLIYVFGGLIRIFIGADFELNDKLKTSPKLALGLVLIYSLGAINELTKLYYNEDDKILNMTIGLSTLVIIAFIYNYIVHVKIVPSYSGKKLNKSSFDELYHKEENESEDLISYKINMRAVEIMDNYSSLFNYMIINIIVSILICLHFFFNQSLMLIPVAIICFFFIARGHTSYIKRNGKPIEKALKKYM